MNTLFLHGALGSASQMNNLVDNLPDSLALNFSGHGGQLYFSSFDIKLFAEDVLTFMDDNKLSKINIFGYSMGGYVGLYLCRYYPEKVNKLMTLATKLNWSKESAAREVKMLNPEMIEEKVPQFAKELGDTHAPNDWKKVVSDTAEMMLRLGDNPLLNESDFKMIEHHVLLTVGDSDKMVSVEETLTVKRIIPNAKICVIPGLEHPINKFPLHYYKNQIVDFFQSN